MFFSITLAVVLSNVPTVRPPASPGYLGPPVLRQAAPDSGSLRREARELQARFERRRARELPRTRIRGGEGPCDEVVGRLCVWDEGDAAIPPAEEPEAVESARGELLASLSVLAEAIPGDHWIFGQRVRYLAEAGRLTDAGSLVGSCVLPQRWRCDAYLGLVRHPQGRTGAAEVAFGRALAAMPRELRSVWVGPDPVLDRDTRHWLAKQPDSIRGVARLWMLADPLFLVEANDRWTGHLGRWTYAMSSEESRSPHQMRWGRDLTEVLVRYGWSVAWERSWPGGSRMSSSVIGRDLPGALRTFPPREVLGPPLDGTQSDTPVVWELAPGHAQSKYLPPYLDSLGALEGQMGRFWRPDGVVIAASARVPVLDADSPVPKEGEAGLFLESDGVLALDVRTPAAANRPVRLSGRAPGSDWGIVSFEVWIPGLRSAYRFRSGVPLRPIPPDVLAISDLMLLEPTGEGADGSGGPAKGEAAAERERPRGQEAVGGELPNRESAALGREPLHFAAMVESLRATPNVGAHEALGVAFEIYGLGFRSEVVGFRAWVEGKDEGWVTRMLRRLGFGQPPDEVVVAWEEPGPDRPQPFFRAFRIRLPGLDPGTYDLVVEASVPGRSPVQRRRRFAVLAPDPEPPSEALPTGLERR